MAPGSQRNGKTPRTEIPSAPSQSPPSDTAMPIPSSTDPISQSCMDTGSQSSALVASEPFELHSLESPASASPENMKTSLSDSQDAQGLAISSCSDSEKRSAQAKDSRQISAEGKKRNKRKAKKAIAQGQVSIVPAVSPDILPLDYCGPMPAPSNTSPKPNVGSPSVSPPLTYAEPTNAEQNLRQENEKLRQKLEEANRLTKGLQESQLRLEEEVEAWKQKCEGFADVVTDLRKDVEGMINSRLSSFFNKMEEGKEKEGREKEEKDEGEEKVRNEKERRGKEGKRKELKEKIGKEEVRKEERGKAEEANLKASQKSQKSYFDQTQAYRQREKAKERRRKKWWNRFRINTSRTSWRRVLIILLLLSLFILVLAPIFLIGIAEIRAYNRAHARRIARLKLKESRNVQLAKAVAQFVADLSPEPIRGTLYHWFLNDGWNLDDPYW
ncbi:hypothetical protein MMC31_000054 [Peltigera leucophlebia]|nr:hypothetical protein [Peltigera leucophlebia]